MNILFLGTPFNPLIPFLKDRGHSVYDTMEPVTPETLDRLSIDFVVSYGYRLILRKDFLDKLPGKIINCHISYLPFNRGADPNFWSFVDVTPAGVSCHLIDPGIDTGPLLFRERVHLTEEMTLRQSYQVLQDEMVRYFKKWWPGIASGALGPEPQPPGGTFHKSKEKFKYIEQIKDEYLDWPIARLLDYIGDIQLSAQHRNWLLNDIRDSN